MLVGYMRVSSDSDRQSTDLQRDALLAAGIDARHLFEDRASGAKDARTGLGQALEFVQPGDVLVVWKLDRLGRSLSHLLTRYEASGNDKVLALITQMSPAAWRRILLNGHYTFQSQGKLIDLDALVAGLGLG